jgi:thiol-disulfide isomerase/thioredoxin
MPQTSTTTVLGTEAPAFTLPDVVSGRSVSLGDIASRGPFLVMFLCNHCPYVQHVEAELGRLARDYAGRKLGLVAISANDAVGYPDDAPVGLAAQAKRAGWTFPYLYDESQAVARAYDAACTPDFFLFDAAGRLAYRGRLDASRPKSSTPVTGRELRAAVDAVLAGRAPAADQQPSLGCGIKWK